MKHSEWLRGFGFVWEDPRQKKQLDEVADHIDSLEFKLDTRSDELVHAKERIDLLEGMLEAAKRHLDRVLNDGAKLRDEDLAREAQLRELLNVYNLGGWMDSERLIRERDEAREAIKHCPVGPCPVLAHLALKELV